MPLPLIPLALIGAGLVALFWPEKERKKRDKVSKNVRSGNGGDPGSQPHDGRQHHGPGGLAPANKRKAKDNERMGMEPDPLGENGSGGTGDDSGSEHGPASTDDDKAEPVKEPEKPAPKKKPRKARQQNEH